MEARPEPVLRFATPSDAGEIVRMIKELAEFKKKPGEASVTPEALKTL